MNQKAVPLLFFAIISVIALFPLLSSFPNWGLYDWDQHMFYHESPRIAMLKYGQFPLWNAHYCGGTPLLANPQSPFLTPFFLTVLAFGAAIGLKIQAILYFFLGLLGTYLAAKRLGANRIAATTAAVIFMLGSWYALRVLVGHTTFFPFALMPWAFLFLLKAFEQLKWAVAAAIALALMFLGGGIYPFYATVLLLAGYSALEAAGSRRLKPLLVVVAILILAFLLSAVKALPVLELTSGVSGEGEAQFGSFGIAARGLLHPSQGIDSGDDFTGRNAVPEGQAKELATLEGRLAWQWHEYSVYVGLLSLLMAAAAVINYRKNWKLLLLALFFLLLSLGDASPIPVWKLLSKLPLFNSLHGPSRLMIVFVFLTALLAAKSLTTMKLPHRSKALLLILALVTAEHLFVFMPLLSNAFPVASAANLQTDNEQFIQFYTSAPYNSQYPNLLQNLGTLNCYERIHVATKALPQFIDGEPYAKFRGNAYVAETGQRLGYSYFSPNKVKVNMENAEINKTATLVVNQNYYPGWKASNGNAKSYNGLLAAEVTQQEREIEFKFMPKSFIIGMAISASALILSLLLLFRPQLLKKIIFKDSGNRQ